MAGSSGRHPPSSVTAATAASIGHRSRTSTGLVEDAKKPAVESDGDKKKPTASSPAKRVVGVSPSLNKATGPRNTMSSTNRRSTLESSKVTERKTLATRSDTTSPTKVASKAAIAPRTTTLSSAPRTTRPLLGSSRLPPRAMTSETATKRFNTIPAAPAVAKAQLGLSDSVAAGHRTPVKPVRPGLVTRTSTMSVTIEQRLREMQLVSDMLQAAMAEDGDEDDEAKEEYGKRMDETLATLRVKLEEARRNEGKDYGSASDSHPDSGISDRMSTAVKVKLDPDTGAPDGLPTAVKVEPDCASGIPDGLPTAVKVESVSGVSAYEASESLRSELVASQTKISNLEADIDVMKTQLLSFSAASENVSQKVQQTTEKLRQEHGAELERISANHMGELEAVHSRLAEAVAQEKRISERCFQDIEEAKRVSMDRGSKETASLLEAQKQSHKDALKALEEELDSEKSNGVDIASRLQHYVSEVLALQTQLEEERERSEDQLQGVNKRFRVMIEEKDDCINSMKREISIIEDKLAQERISHIRELKETKLGYELRVNELEDKLVASDCRILELQDAVDVTMTEHGSILQAKEHEILSLGQVIESLQEQVQGIQQHKEQELDTAKAQMFREHQNALQKLQAEHELGLKRSQAEADERVAELIAHYEQETGRSDAACNKETMDKLEFEDSMSLAAAAEGVKKTSSDSSESDCLRKEITELTKQHAIEILKIQETLRTENEKRNMERKQGAEVRDRLASEVRELESVRKELPPVREEAERYRMSAELARLEMHEVDNRLQQALAASQDHEASHRDLSVEVDKLRAELADLKAKPAGSKGHSKQLSSHSHELEALQIMADKEREYTDKLKKQLDEATVAADRHATRVREVEAALKVTTAELTEMRTRRANGQDFTNSPAPKGRLRTSRWISQSSQENHATESDWSGVGLGPHIEGTVG
ncbi:MAG: hypothetical protein Q9187_003628 [Circinaria calcarea]